MYYICLKQKQNIMKTIVNYLKDYFKDIKLSEINFRSLAGAASRTTQNI